ncbi:hypothetical protein X755_15930 [Mesorhizobium sp. LNJC405B00]|nr:hypothetical protein X755_15930 [Mesorhizobium sp. LNJC405B00]
MKSLAQDNSTPAMQKLLIAVALGGEAYSQLWIFCLEKLLLKG